MSSPRSSCFSGDRTLKSNLPARRLRGPVKANPGCQEPCSQKRPANGKQNCKKQARHRIFGKCSHDEIGQPAQGKQMNPGRGQERKDSQPMAAGKLSVLVYSVLQRLV